MVFGKRSELLVFVFGVWCLVFGVGVWCLVFGVVLVFKISYFNFLAIFQYLF